MGGGGSSYNFSATTSAPSINYSSSSLVNLGSIGSSFFSNSYNANSFPITSHDLLNWTPPTMTANPMTSFSAAPKFSAAPSVPFNAAPSSYHFETSTLSGPNAAPASSQPLSFDLNSAIFDVASFVPNITGLGGQMSQSFGLPDIGLGTLQNLGLPLDLAGPNFDLPPIILPGDGRSVFDTLPTTSTGNQISVSDFSSAPAFGWDLFPRQHSIAPGTSMVPPPEPTPTFPPSVVPLFPTDSLDGSFRLGPTITLPSPLAFNYPVGATALKSSQYIVPLGNPLLAPPSMSATGSASAFDGMSPADVLIHLSRVPSNAMDFETRMRIAEYNLNQIAPNFRPYYEAVNDIFQPPPKIDVRPVPRGGR